MSSRAIGQIFCSPFLLKGGVLFPVAWMSCSALFRETMSADDDENVVQNKEEFQAKPTIHGHNEATEGANNGTDAPPIRTEEKLEAQRQQLRETKAMKEAAQAYRFAKGGCIHGVFRATTCGHPHKIRWDRNACAALRSPTVPGPKQRFGRE